MEGIADLPVTCLKGHDYRAVVRDVGCCPIFRQQLESSSAAVSIPVSDKTYWAYEERLGHGIAEWQPVFFCCY